jgi:heptosyltransferase-2
VVKEVNWLGDLVISLPALRAVRDRYPKSYLAVVVRQNLAGFFDGVDWIDEIIRYDAPRGLSRISADWRLAREIRSRGFDLAILFPNSFSSALLAAVAQVPRRVGFATNGRGLLLTKRAYPTDTAMHGHQAEYWLELVRTTVGTDGKARLLALAPAEVHRARMEAAIASRRSYSGAPLIALAPAAAYGPAKEWPAARFVSLIELLAERHGAECVLVGAPNEVDRCTRIAAASGRNAFSMAGETTVGELIALLSLCDGFAGNDSGAMHLSSALGIPTVGLFGSTNPVRSLQVSYGDHPGRSGYRA